MGFTSSGKPSIGNSLEAKRISGGFLGRLFGLGDNIIKNAGALLAVLLLFSIVAMLVMGDQTIKESAKLLIPVFTLIVGYMFGAKAK